MRTIPILALALALTGPAAAQFTPMATAVPDSVPGGMNYQGRLEQDGFPVTGTRTMAFRLYDASSGGTALYNSGNMSVAIQQGIFSVSLDIPFGSLTGTAQKYLELEVEGIVLAPRDALRSVPYAKVAETVEGTINISTAGLTFTTNVGDSLAISSGSGRVGIGTASPAARLHVSSGAGETGTILLVSTGASALATVDGNGVMTANFFVGDGTNLRNVVRRTGDSMSGPLTLNGSTLTVGGSGFSVAGAEFTVGSGRTGVGTASPLAVLTVVGDSSFSQPSTFLSSVTVRNGAQFGAGAKQSSFTAAGDLTLHQDSSLTVGTTFFVGNARVGVGTGSPSANSRLHVVGDVLVGNPVIHDTSGSSDLLVEGNVIVDGTFIQHGAGGSVFDRLSVSGGIQGNQTFAVGYTSFGVTTGGNVGINTLTPLSKLTVNGDSAFAGASTFASSVTVAGASALKGTLGVEGTTFMGSSLTVREKAEFGSTGVSSFTAAGALTIAAGQNIRLTANGEVLGLPTTPTVNDAAASKAYVISQTLAGSGWSGSAGKVILNVVTDNVGIGATTPGAKLDVEGSQKVAGAATFAGTATFLNTTGFGAASQSQFSNTGVLTLGTPLATGQGGTGNINGTVAALTSNPADAPSGFVCRGINASGTCEPAEVDAAAASGSTNPVQSGALFTHAGLTNPHSATSANTANRIVMRGASGEFSAGAITASLTGNADTATALAANPADAVSGRFCRGITANGSCEPGEVDAAAASGSTNPVQSGALFTHAGLTNPHSATSANTADRIVLRGASGEFSAGAITADSLSLASGKVTSAGADPVVSACGTTPLITGSDTAGKVTIGGGGATTSCTLTFSAAYANPPACVVLGNNSAPNLAATSTTTTLVITSSADMQSHVLMYLCVGL